MCVHTSLSQDGFHRKGVWVEHPLASFPFGLQGAFLCMCGQGSLLTSRMRNMWSGRALPPHLIVLLLSSWIFSPQGMNLQSLYPVGSWGSIYLLPHLEDVNHKNKKQTKNPLLPFHESFIAYSLLFLVTWLEETLEVQALDFCQFLSHQEIDPVLILKHAKVSRCGGGCDRRAERRAISRKGVSFRAQEMRENK